MPNSDTEYGADGAVTAVGESGYAVTQVPEDIKQGCTFGRQGGRVQYFFRCAHLSSPFLDRSEQDVLWYHVLPSSTLLLAE